MRAVVPLPAVDFYIWQAVVQRYALSQLGWDVTYLVYYTTRRPPPRLAKLSAVAEVEAWEDWRTADLHGYNPSMKPWLVGKWLERYPHHIDKPLLLMDPDVVPTGVHEMPTPEPMRWWGTDTDSYTGPGYLRSKGEGMWRGLCDIVGVAADEAARHPGIGAQYTFTGAAPEFWSTVAEKSVEAYTFMQRTAKEFTPLFPDGTRGLPVQAWCSEMYVMQLEMIRRGIEPRMSDAMEMVWANGPASDWDRVGFFHDAGIVDPEPGHFHKQTYQVSPWKKRLAVDASSASARYVELIREVGRAWPKSIW